MIKTIKTMSKQEKERYTVPRKVQDVIPVRRIWQDGIFLTGNKFSKTYQFSDINYLVASREDKESMFLIYSELLNSLDSGAVTKITINNRRTNKANFENSILMPMQEDFRDEYRREYNQMLLDKATGANGITQEKYITISVVKKDIEEARAYFSRVGADLISHFAALGSKCVELDASERLRILHDFYRQGEEAEFSFDLAAMAKRGAYPTAITQNVEYLLDSVQASTMLSNSEFIVMLNQAASDREKLSKLLNISKEQMSYVTNADAGCGLIRYGSALVPFVNRFPRNTKLYALMTTKPGEGVFGGEEVLV